MDYWRTAIMIHQCCHKITDIWTKIFGFMQSKPNILYTVTFQIEDFKFSDSIKCRPHFCQLSAFLICCISWNLFLDLFWFARDVTFRFFWDLVCSSDSEAHLFNFTVYLTYCIGSKCPLTVLVLADSCFTVSQFIEFKQLSKRIVTFQNSALSYEIYSVEFALLILHLCVIMS